MQSPPAQPSESVFIPPPQNWHTSLCNCCNDSAICCTVCFAPCLVHAENVRKLTGDSGAPYIVELFIHAALCSVCCSLTCLYCWGCQCFLGVDRRRLLRIKYGLPEAPCNDFCLHCCCHLCALCQEARELNIRTATEGQSVMFARLTPPLTSAPPPPPLPQTQFGAYPTGRLAKGLGCR